MGNQLICGSKFDSYSVDNMNQKLVNEDIIDNQLENNEISNETNNETNNKTNNKKINKKLITN